jgi:diguanylate cyclase (GGDEF)-like protein
MKSEGTVRHTPQPLSRETLFRQVGPLLGGALLVVISMAMAQTGATEGALLIKAAILTAITIAAMALVPWRHLPGVVKVAPAIAYLTVCFLIRQATGGGDSMYAQLLLAPILWLAVYGSMLEVATGLGGIAVILFGPMLVIPGTEEQWPRALLLTGTAGFLGYGLQRLFAQLRAQSSRLIVLSKTDPLTGVGNRRAWDDELHEILLDAEKDRSHVCVALIDLDRFKEFNDGRGHQAGDRLLKETTAEWRNHLRDRDILARIGGDEFAIVLAGCPLEAAHRIMIRLCGGLPAGQTCSSGLAEWDWMESAEELIARADSALYRAKERGRNRIVVA